MKKQNGFTLIELLIVISVIAILSGVMLRVIDIQSLNKKSRDSQRLADAKKVQTALELYYVDNRVYPKSCTTSNCTAEIEITGSDTLSTSTLKNYIDIMPVGPLYSSDPSKYKWRYFSNDGKTYTIKVPNEFDTTINTCANNPFTNLGCLIYTNPL